MSKLIKTTMAVYEYLNFDHSTKNIPISNKTEYKLKLFDEVRNFCRRARIKLYFCTDEEYNKNLIDNKETYVNKISNLH